VILVGLPGFDRKGTAVTMSEKIINRIQPDMKAPNEMSPEGLIAFLAERDASETGPAFIAYQEEFLNLLLQFRKHYAQALKALMLEFYNVPDSYFRRLRKGSMAIHHPRIALIGAIAKEFLARYGQTEDWLGGFFSRAMLIQAEKTRYQVDLPEVEDKTFDDLAFGLGEGLAAWKEAQEARAYAPFKLSPEAKLVGRELQDGSADPQLHSLLSRSRNHWQKIAAIEQIDEDPQAPEIGRAAAMRAFEFVRTWQLSVPELVSSCFARDRSDFEGDRLAKSIVRMLGAAPKGVTVATMLRSVGMDVRKVNEAMDSLIQAGVVEVKMAAKDGDQRFILAGKKVGVRAEGSPSGRRRP
jgi:hypothetical protein